MLLDWWIRIIYIYKITFGTAYLVFKYTMGFFLFKTRNPTLNNFHSGLTDRQLPLSSRHSKGQWGRRKCDRKSVWQRESKKMSVDIWGEVGVFDSCGYVDSRYERVQQQIQIKHIWITDPRRITRRFWVWTGPFQLKGWTRPGSDSSHFPEDSTRPTTAG